MISAEMAVRYSLWLQVSSVICSSTDLLALQYHANLIIIMSSGIPLRNLELLVLIRSTDKLAMPNSSSSVVSNAGKDTPVIITLDG